MELTAHPTGVIDISPDELRAFQAAHPETQYQLIDVRQPEEYQAEHIPGARLLPLGEAEKRVGELLESDAPFKIIYCRSGGRSARAAAFFAQAGVTNVFNLRGGMLGWNGERVSDFPKLRAFDEATTVKDVLLQAMNLEKGADRLYSALRPVVQGTPAERTVDMLARAEEAHSRALYGALKKLGDEHVIEDFEVLSGKMSGELLETGHRFEDVVGVAKGAAGRGAQALLELAVELEYRAYDLYRNLATLSKDQAVRGTFLHLADEEKKHARAVLKALGEAATMVH
ncbi:MAG: rhodanese-like domain-containing protein [Myxococcota bacterium]|jgi:rhodanese-related sulfurtransferase/rubrerythrin